MTTLWDTIPDLEEGGGRRIGGGEEEEEEESIFSEVCAWQVRSQTEFGLSSVGAGPEDIELHATN